MGITRFTTNVTLTIGTAKESTGAAVIGRPVWTVAWTIHVFADSDKIGTRRQPAIFARSSVYF